jgi:ABC-2 type transport system ATP-binding protein
LAEEFIQQSEILPQQKVKKMSKGMVTQLHLALAVAINSDLLVLDEPTLGLDILRRKHFYQKLLEDHFDENNTIVITTHQIEEIENIITRLIYVDGGQVILDIQVNDLAARFVQLTILPPELDAVKALNPLCISATLSGIECIFDGVDKSQLEQYGSINTPNINNIVSAFMALQQEESRNV